MTNDADLARLLRDPARAGVREVPPGDVEAVEASARELGFATFRIELGDCADKAALLARVAAAMHFPDWFGHNWDALSDCLADMSWRPARGYVVVLAGADTLGAAAPDTLATALEIFGEAAREWAREAVPMQVFVAPAGSMSAHVPPVDPVRFKTPVSVLVVVHTPALEVLLLERVSPPGFWQSVTGSLEAGESPAEAALRELAEETGLAPGPGRLVDWHHANRFEIRPEWRRRYAPDVTHNTEHVFSLCLPAPCPVRLAPDEHAAYEWLPHAAAAARASSWTNRDAIERLVRGGGSAANG